MDIGINLAPVNDWNREWVFLDLFKQSRDWRLIKDGQVQQKSVIVPTDDLGNPILQPGEGAQSLVLTNQQGHYPKDQYNIYFEGSGQIKFVGQGVNEISRQPFNNGIFIKLDVQGDHGFAVEVYGSIQKISIIWPKLTNLYDITSFHPLFIKDLRRFKYIRFLNWMNTNSVVNQFTWENRTTPNSVRQSYHDQGVALEYMVELCNITKTSPWFCMPHLYMEDYVRKFAQYVKDHLNPKSKIYVEFSNETWNDIFPQHKWAQNKANAEGTIWPYIIINEAKKVWDIWLSVFGDQEARIIRTIGGNAASTWPIQKMLEKYIPNLVAIAAYFGPTPDQIHNMDPNITAEALLDMSILNIPLRESFIRNHKNICGNIPVGIYEGGQGIVGKGNWLNSAYNAQILPEMYEATYDMLNIAKSLDCSTFGVFQYSGDRTDSNGSWGHFEWQDQALLSPEKLKLEVPKMAAVRDFIAGGNI